MHRFHSLNEDFFDDNQIETTVDITDDNIDGTFEHQLVFSISGGDLFTEYETLLVHFKRFEKKLRLVLEYCTQITNYSDIEYTAGGNKAFGLNNLNQFFNENRLKRIYAKVNINASFDNIKQFDKLLKTCFTKLRTSKEAPLLYLSRVNDLTSYLYNNKTTNNEFVIKFSPLLKEYVGTERPFMTMSEYYGINVADNIISEMLGRFGNSTHLNKKPDFNKAKFNTVRLYLPGFIEKDKGAVYYNMETDETEHQYIAYKATSEEYIKDVCNKALSFAKNSHKSMTTFVYQQNGGFGGVACIFSETFVYEDVEYIVVASYEFESKVAHYTISKEDIQKVKDEVIDVYNLPANVVERYCKTLMWNN